MTPLNLDKNLKLRVFSSSELHIFIQLKLFVIMINAILNCVDSEREHSPLILLWLRTGIPVHAQTAAWQQSNGNSKARMSGKCEKWRDIYHDFILDPIGPSAR